MNQPASAADGPAGLLDSEARLGSLMRLSDALRALDDAADIRATASRILGEALGADRVGHADALPEDGEMMVRTDGAATYPRSEVGSGWAISAPPRSSSSAPVRP